MSLTKSEVLAKIGTTGLVPVLRAPSEGHALAVADAILLGGVDILEVTMTVPGAIPLIRHLRKLHPNLLVGAGTVLDPETARICILEGAQFIVSPALNLETVATCLRHEIAVLPGALTPTEIVTAWQAGADLIKVFPANSMGGAPYLKSLKAPLPQVELIPTGGVSLANARSFLEAGAFALGIGADLANCDAITAGQAHTITARAREYLHIIQDFRTA
jgi:2-dehydro-3-deoxyphosphogluconate aldolase/(4S)-4-hydroxy-2-oxoglutarate aldolase